MDNDQKDVIETIILHQCHHRLADLFPIQEQRQHARGLFTQCCGCVSIAVIVAGTLIILFDWWLIDAIETQGLRPAFFCYHARNQVE